MDQSALSTVTRPLVSWLATYGVHGTVWLLAALLAVRWLATPRGRELALKGAVVAAFVTASVAHWSPQRPGFALAPLVAERDAATPTPSPVEAGIDTPVEWLSVTRQADAATRAGAAAAGTATIDWTLWLGGAWVLFALLGLVHFGLVRRRLMRLLGAREEIVAGPAFDQWKELCTRAPRAPRARLTRSHGFPSPVTLVGEVCIPARAECELSPDERQGLLAHELAHVARRDPHWLFALHALERAFFFQPLLRVARKRIQADMELASDDWAVALLRGPLQVARCLARVAEWLEGEPPQALTPAMATSRSALVERVERLVSARTQRSSVGAVVALALLSGATAAAMSLAGPRVDLRQARPAGVATDSSWRDVVAGVQAERAAAQELDVETYRIAVGDEVRIVDFRNREHLDVRETIGALGTVMLPEVGVIEVVGLTQAELRAKLTKVYEQYFAQTDVHVQVLPAARELFIYGHVEKKGPRRLAAGLTVLEAVTRAGPDANTANLRKVAVIRADPRDPLIFQVDLREMRETGDTSQNILLQSGDIVFVPGKELARRVEPAAGPESSERAALEGRIKRYLQAQEDARREREDLDSIELELGAGGAIRARDGEVFGASGAVDYAAVEAWLRGVLGIERGSAPRTSERTLVIAGTAASQFDRVQRLLEVGARCGVYKWEFRVDEKTLSGALPRDLAQIEEAIEEGALDTDPVWSRSPIEVSLGVQRAGEKIDPETGAPWSGEGRYAYDASRMLRYEVVGRVGRVDDIDVVNRTTANGIAAVEGALQQLHEHYPDRAVTIDARPGTVYADVLRVVDAIVLAGFTDIRFVGARR